MTQTAELEYDELIADLVDAETELSDSGGCEDCRFARAEAVRSVRKWIVLHKPDWIRERTMEFVEFEVSPHDRSHQ